MIPPPPKERGRAGLHAQIADLLSLALGPAGITNSDGTMWFTIENAEQHEGARIERARRGCVAGIPDIQIVRRGRCYFIELKRPGSPSPGKVPLSKLQVEFHNQLALAGAVVATRDTAEQVLGALDGWRIPRCRVQLGTLGPRVPGAGSIGDFAHIQPEGVAK